MKQWLLLNDDCYKNITHCVTASMCYLYFNEADLYLCYTIGVMETINSLRPRSSRRHFADDMFKCISLIENVSTPIEISLKFVPRGPINNIPALVQIMA